MEKCANCGTRLVSVEYKEEDGTWETMMVCDECGYEETEARDYGEQEASFIKDDCWQS